MDKSAPRQRDRERTKQAFIDAAIAIIRESGFTELGVNAVAERAGVSKVLLYRYFGGLSGLYRAVATEIDPLQSRAAARLLEELDTQDPPAEIIRRTIVELHDALKNDDLTKNLLIWELTNQNSVTEAMSVAREETGLQLTEEFRNRLSRAGVEDDIDLNALMALVTAGVFYLTLRSDSVDMFNGVNISSREGWERIAATLAGLIERRNG